AAGAKDPRCSAPDRGDPEGREPGAPSGDHRGHGGRGPAIQGAPGGLCGRGEDPRGSRGVAARGSQRRTWSLTAVRRESLTYQEIVAEDRNSVAHSPPERRPTTRAVAAQGVLCSEPSRSSHYKETIKRHRVHLPGSTPATCLRKTRSPRRPRLSGRVRVVGASSGRSTRAVARTMRGYGVRSAGAIYAGSASRGVTEGAT